MKDNFSKDSDNYSRYRPDYPEELFRYIFSKVQNHDYAWDCATGNGQVALKLAEKFLKIDATDLSEAQIKQAMNKNNVNYSVQVAEHTNFKDNAFDLVTVGQALHWFDFDRFFNEVKRVLKPEGLFVAFGYGLNSVNEEIDSITRRFYFDIIGQYWDEERKYIDDQYSSIEFPFEKLEKRNFINILQWDVEHYLGYLNTWSAVKHFQGKNSFNPVNEIETELKDTWGSLVREVTFPIFLVSGEKE